jgi:diadenosine tetraphosphate (Ap4A) HIT family hydrolase
MKQTDQLPGCELCQTTGGVLVVQTAQLRVVRVEDANFPAFYRVIWRAHRAELSDLDADERALCLDAVVRVEQVLRERLQPSKINLASLGNMVAHLHWHVIARFDWDSHFPQPIWGVAQRQVEPPALSRLACALPELDASVAKAFA